MSLEVLYQTEFVGSIEPKEPDTIELQSLCKGEGLTEKVLGLFWFPKDDIFCFILKFSKLPDAVLNGNRIPTKREVLSLTMSIFDPFGLVADIVIRSKLILQELWRHSLDWNTPIPPEMYKKWYEWYVELQNVQNIQIERCYSRKFSDPSTLIDLHIFVDASEVAFAAVGYWRIVSNGQIDVKFVAGKSKCAPLKPLSIPRLELQAAVLGVRLKEAIVSSHDIHPGKVVFWSDSKTVIQWIHSDCRIYKQFVSHRIAEVLESSEPNEWRWIPGSKNPADDATRPHYFSGNVSTSRWLNGPKFLKGDECQWPQLPAGNIDEQSKAEIRTKFLTTITETKCLIPYDLTSTYYLLLRKFGWLLRAINIFKSFMFRRNTNNVYSTYLTSKEIKQAEIFAKIWKGYFKR